MVYVSCWASKELLTPWHAATALFIRTQMHARPGKLLIRYPIGGHWLWQSFFFYSILFFYMRIISWCPQLARPLATQGWSYNSAHSNQNDHSIRLESAHNPIGVRLILNAFNRYQPVSIGHFEFSLLVFVVVFFFLLPKCFRFISNAASRCFRFMVKWLRAIIEILCRLRRLVFIFYFYYFVSVVIGEVKMRY